MTNYENLVKKNVTFLRQAGQIEVQVKFNELADQTHVRQGPFNCRIAQTKIFVHKIKAKHDLCCIRHHSRLDFRRMHTIQYHQQTLKDHQTHHLNERSLAHTPNGLSTHCKVWYFQEALIARMVNAIPKVVIQNLSKIERQILKNIFFNNATIIKKSGDILL